MYSNSFANYFSMNVLQTCTKCMLVCAGLLAIASSHFFVQISARPPTPIHVFKILCQLFWHKCASNLHQMYASMCRFVGQCLRPVLCLNFCLSTHKYKYLKSCANYFGKNMLQTCTKCMLVCRSIVRCRQRVIFWCSAGHIFACPPTP